MSESIEKQNFTFDDANYESVVTLSSGVTYRFDQNRDVEVETMDTLPTNLMPKANGDVFVPHLPQDSDGNYHLLILHAGVYGQRAIVIEQLTKEEAIDMKAKIDAAHG